jgi:two-component system, LytTR family, response regulator
MTIKSVVIDDEASNRQLLSIMLHDFCPDVELLGEAESLESGIKLIEREDPELVFLDIEMPGGNGFDLLRHFKDRDFDVIFTTAYNQYALLAFKFSAIDYLLKPIDPTELSAAVEKVGAKRKSGKGNMDSLRVLLENISRNGELPRKLMIPDQNGFAVTEVSEIIRFSGEGSYTTVVLTGNRKLVTSKSLGAFEELVERFNFFRVHHSHLINLDHVQKYNRGRGGSVTMIDGEEIEVSRRKKDDFIARMGGKE